MAELLNTIARLWWDWTAAMFWQVGLLIILIGCLDLLVRKWAWPQLRYALWSLILLKLLLPPTLSLPSGVVPGLQSRVAQVFRTLESEKPTPVGNPDVIADCGLQIADLNLSVGPQFATAGPQAAGSEVAVHGFTTMDSTQAANPPSAISHPQLAWQVHAMMIWLAGTFLLGTWLWLRLHALAGRHAYSAAAASLPQSFYSQLAGCAQRLGLRRVPAVAVTKKLATPAVFGVFRPVLLMPKGCLSKLSRKDTEHMLLHELAHIKRGDLFTHGLYMVLQILYWYNPLLWLVRRQMHHLRELSCDATVAGLLREQTKAYRQTLLDSARRLLATSVEPGLGLLGLFEDSNRLLVRLHWLTKPTWRYRTMKRAIVIATAALMVACVLPMAQARESASDNVTQVNKDNLEIIGETLPVRIEEPSREAQDQLSRDMAELQARLEQLMLQQRDLQKKLQALAEQRNQMRSSRESSRAARPRPDVRPRPEPVPEGRNRAVVPREPPASAEAQEQMRRAQEFFQQAQQAMRAAQKAQEEALRATAVAEEARADVRREEQLAHVDEQRAQLEEHRAQLDEQRAQMEQMHEQLRQNLRGKDAMKNWQKQMEQWSGQMEQWQNGPAMKDWKERIDRWGQEQVERSMRSTGESRGESSPVPAEPMPAMPPMPGMPPMPPKPAPAPRVEATVPRVPAHDELLGLPDGDRVIDVQLPERVNLVDLLDLVGKHTGMSWMYDPAYVAGEVSLGLRGRLTGAVRVKDLYRLLQAALESRDLAMVRLDGNIVAIVPKGKQLGVSHVPGEVHVPSINGPHVEAPPVDVPVIIPPEPPEPSAEAMNQKEAVSGVGCGPLPGDRFLEVSNPVGSITVRVGDRPEYLIRGRVIGRADTEERAHEIAEQLVHFVERGADADGRERIIVSKPEGLREGESYRVVLEITAPREARLKLSQAVGDIRLTDLRGLIEASTQVGAIRATDVSGQVALSANVGGIDYIAPAGLSAKVQAKANLGAIQSDLPLAATKSRGPGLGSSAFAMIGGGEDNIFLSTNTGSIRIRTAHAPTIVAPSRPAPAPTPAPAPAPAPAPTPEPQEVF